VKQEYKRAKSLELFAPAQMQICSDMKARQ
jgi:hypothetical protein